MQRTISMEGKLREGRGTGEGRNYLPWLKAREVSSIGTCHNIVDWKHGRTVELLSEGEMALYFLLRWDDKTADIREQYPLDLDQTNAIADEAGIMRVNQGKDNMTTDLVVTGTDGSLRAYSVKAEKVSRPRDIEKLWIEKMYWNAQGVLWKQVYKKDLNFVYVNNIRLCVEYYDENRVHDAVSRIKHLIAVKQMTVDMESAPLNFQELAKDQPEVL